ncbi:MAG: hypothetical protein DKM50_14120 [Candidatus Margulisiibacteriota bacterium]|nr:MAG: hypothetical protein A2X43_09255 [Candidatus Margulisbacteria bacterium GWD2_39_127]OGI05379.1 MAG: hypothetical protein A2X42_04155 [Candidatus Margulisbacteria bacterium GWF2_38_17]OGI09063.1 MAG: hypothetical protein A2X41_00860 [Candidatus Margulisbacteria bacterium GWE2_39_32]PZM77010.1 MAG: hypothetical protein DKM50_14120 [Candidatus Margulisiibacteriota bacterium]HAR64064.1 hypothetical protein [Candidatus Margulisiibacteriota bacterium]
MGRKAARINKFIIYFHKKMEVNHHFHFFIGTPGRALALGEENYNRAPIIRNKQHRENAGDGISTGYRKSTYG